MPYAASLSTLSDTEAALDEACRDVQEQLGGLQPHLMFLFVTHSHLGSDLELAAAIREQFDCEVLLGCAGEFIAGQTQEIEEGPGLALWAAVLPGAQLEPFHMEFRMTADGLVGDGFPEVNDTAFDEIRAVFLIGDPLSTSTTFVLEQFSDMLPGVPLLGGMASGGAGRGQNRLFYQDEMLDHGAIGVIVRGGPRVLSIVSQGCRPIGHPFVVTRSEGNVIHELGGRPALERLRETWQDLSPAEQRLIRQGLQVGIVMNEYLPEFRRGDFLVANVMGADQDTGAIALGNFVRTGQTMQFHVRDAETADEELRLLLLRETEGRQIGGALLFSCNGRGTRLFAEPHHDANAILTQCGPIPLAGFFAQGELGPVGGKNHIHGYTASVVLFEDA